MESSSHPRDLQRTATIWGDKSTCLDVASFKSIKLIFNGGGEAIVIGRHKKFHWVSELSKSDQMLLNLI